MQIIIKLGVCFKKAYLMIPGASLQTQTRGGHGDMRARCLGISWKLRFESYQCYPVEIDSCSGFDSCRLNRYHVRINIPSLSEIVEKSNCGKCKKALNLV